MIDYYIVIMSLLLHSMNEKNKFLIWRVKK